MKGHWATRWKLAAIIAAILLASCGPRPGVTVSVAGATVPMILASATERTSCSSNHGDAFPQNLPLTTVRGPTPVMLKFEAGQGASEIRGWICDVDAPTSGGPLEQFTIPGRTGTPRGRSSRHGRTRST